MLSYKLCSFIRYAQLYYAQLYYAQLYYAQLSLLIAMQRCQWLTMRLQLGK